MKQAEIAKKILTAEHQRLLQSALKKVQSGGTLTSAERRAVSAESGEHEWWRMNLDQIAQIFRIGHRRARKIAERLSSFIKGGPSVGDSVDVREFYSEISKSGGGEDGITLEQARIAESQSKTRLNNIEIECKEKTRIPIEVLNDVMESVFGEIKSVIDRSALSEKEKSQVREEIRDIPNRLKW